MVLYHHVLGAGYVTVNKTDMDPAIYLFMAALGLCCRSGFSLVAEVWGFSLVAVCVLLIGVASCVAEHQL